MRFLYFSERCNRAFFQENGSPRLLEVHSFCYLDFGPPKTNPKYCKKIKKFKFAYLCNRELIRVSIPGFCGEMAIVLARSGHILTLESGLIFWTITVCSLRSGMPVEIILVYFWRPTKLSSAWTLARASTFGRTKVHASFVLFERLLAAL